MVAAVMVFTGCNNNNGNKAQLIANEWQLKEMLTENGKIDLPKRVPTIMFSDSTRVFGFSGCNRFMGKYEIKGNTISIDPGASTMMACLDMTLEKQFTKALTNVKTYTVANHELQLKDKTGQLVLTFIPKQEEAVTEEKEAVATPLADSTVISYQGGDGKTKMLHHMSVTYFPSTEKAIVHYREQTYNLTQRVSASGVWYSDDDKVTLRGKGKNMTLSLPDGKELTMNEIEQ